MNQVIIWRELESINLSATNGTFVTKGEIESNFLTTLTDEPKLNHWVKTIVNQIVIQFESSRRCIKKVTFYFSFFLKIVKKWLKSTVFDKTSSGGGRRRYYQKIKQNSHWQDTCEKKCYLLFLLKFVSTCCFDLLKKKNISNFNEISLKKEENKAKAISAKLLDLNLKN